MAASRPRPTSASARCARSTSPLSAASAATTALKIRLSAAIAVDALSSSATSSSSTAVPRYQCSARKCAPKYVDASASPTSVPRARHAWAARSAASRSPARIRRMTSIASVTNRIACIANASAAFAQLGELAVGGQPREEGVGGRPQHPHEHLELVARRPGDVEELGRHRDPGVRVLGPEHHVVHEGEGPGEGGGVLEGAHVVDRGERGVDRADAGGGALGGPAQPEHRGERRGLGRVVAGEQLERAVDTAS